MNIHQVAFEFRGKVRKTEAQVIILELAKKYPDETVQLGQLLALMAPPMKKAGNTFAWVAKAVASNKESRKYLRFVMCTGTMMVATDGSRLHAAPQTDKAPGLYDPKSGERIFNLFENYPDGEVPGDHPGKYPDWQRIVPRDRHAAEVELEYAQFANTVAVGVGDVWVPVEHWNAASRVYDRASFGDSVYLEGSNGEFAVIMPLRKEWVDKHRSN